MRAVRGPVPRSGDVVVLDVADLFAGRTEHDKKAYQGAGKASGEANGVATHDETEELTEALLSGWWTSATRIGKFEGHPDRRRRPGPGLSSHSSGSPNNPASQNTASQNALSRNSVSPGETRPHGATEPGAEAIDGSDVRARTSALSAALSASPYFRGSPELAAAEARALSRYLTDLKLRHEVRDRTQAAILPDTKVVVGHGIGALIAYEALCALSDAVSVTFVSLGAAMCGPQQVFTRLEPAPRNEQGHWPAAIRRWFNVVAHSDPTAMIAPQLTERFGPGIEDEVIEIKTSCGDLQPYLLDRATGRALATGLVG
ncbi:MAG TPA: hypothetical protein VFA06_11665 [Actinocrinis sp.]|uniref:hypothetical protein n=1 Tax=Actinocrinis sp. TaxID=1920516 RepID=UPI002D265154|nr:hypothetical protein [Actinocrinis sp.]HZU56517.1 hypothetical protein [Actinocrinis sp.]